MGCDDVAGDRNEQDFRGSELKGLQVDTGGFQLSYCTVVA